MIKFLWLSVHLSLGIGVRPKQRRVSGLIPKCPLTELPERWLGGIDTKHFIAYNDEDKSEYLFVSIHNGAFTKETGDRLAKYTASKDWVHIRGNDLKVLRKYILELRRRNEEIQII